MASTRFQLPFMALLFGVLAFTPALKEREHWSRAEGRPPVIARDMLATGRVAPPYLAGRAYLNKPPLYHALVAAVFWVTGEESNWAAKFPAALAGILLVWMTALIARDEAQRRGHADHGVLAGAVSAIVLALIYRAFELSRSAELETLLSASLAVSYYGISKVVHGESGRSWLWVAIGVLLATWTKGPVLAILFPCLFILAHAAAGASRSDRSVGLSTWCRLVGVVVAAVLVASLAYWGPLLADPDTRAALWDRLALKNNSHVKGPFVYVLKWPIGLGAALVFAPSILHGWMRKKVSRAWPLFIGLGLVALSLPASKQSHYLLPLDAIFAASGGVIVAGRMQRGQRHEWWVLAVLTILAGASAFVLPSLLPALNWDAAGRGWVFGAGAFIFIVGGVAARRLAQWGEEQPTGYLARAPWPAGLGAIMVLIAATTGFARMENENRSPKLAMEQFAQIVAEAPLVSLDRDTTVLWYLGRTDTLLVGSGAEAASWLAAHPTGYVVLESDEGQAIPAELRSARVASRWMAPRGGRGFVLLGPGGR